MPRVIVWLHFLPSVNELPAAPPVPACVLLNGGVGYVQERRAEQAMAAFQAMAATTARVLRDWRPQVIAVAEVALCDILLIEEGDTIAADGRVLEAVALQMDESVLTEESLPAPKTAMPLDQAVGLGISVRWSSAAQQLLPGVDMPWSRTRVQRTHGPAACAGAQTCRCRDAPLHNRHVY